jgi:hypothetical protein
VPKCHIELNIKLHTFSIVALDADQYFISKERFQYPFDGRLGGPQIYSRFGGKETNLEPAGNQTQMIQSFANNFN